MRVMATPRKETDDVVVVLEEETSREPEEPEPTLEETSKEIPQQTSQGISEHHAPFLRTLGHQVSSLKLSCIVAAPRVDA